MIAPSPNLVTVEALADHLRSPLPGDPPGVWLGAGAAAMGLPVQATAAVMEAVFHGNAPQGPSLEVPSRDVRAEGDAGARVLDFAPPPSVSALWAVAPEPMRKEIESAQFKAVRAALAYLETEAARVRRADGGLEPAGLVAAAFERSSADGRTPGFHTRVVLFRVASLGREGWTPKGFETALFNRHLEVADALFQAELAHQLRIWSRLKLETDGPSFRVAGIPDETLVALSRLSRLPGTPDRELLHATWHANARRNGLPEVGSLCGWSGGLADHRAAFERCREAVNRLDEDFDRFRPRDVVLALARSSRCGELNAAEIRHYARHHIEAGAFHRSASDDELILRTCHQIALERRIDETARSRAQDPRFQVASEHLRWPCMGLSQAEKRALLDLTQGPKSCVYLDGLPPGDRDVFLLKASQAWNQAGMEVTTLCGEDATLKSLRQKCGLSRSGRTDDVLDRLVPDWAKSKEIKHRPGLVGRLLDAVKRQPRPGRPPILRRLSAGRRVSVDENTVLVATDAATLGPHRTSALLRIMETTGAKLVLVGDDRSLEDSRSQSPISAFQRADAVVTIGAPRPGPELGPGPNPLVDLTRAGNLSVSEDSQQLLAEWATTRRDLGLLLASSNEERTGLNFRAQAERKARGELGEKSVRLADGPVHEGDRFIVRCRADGLGLNRGTTGTILKIVDDGRHPPMLHLLTDDHRRRSVPVNECQHLGLGYAATLREAAHTRAEKLFIPITLRTPVRLRHALRGSLELSRATQAPSRSTPHQPSRTQPRNQGPSLGR